MARLKSNRIEPLRARHAEALAREGFFPKPPREILFMCYGNICRSPVAEHVWNMLAAERTAEGIFPEAASATSAGFLDNGQTVPPRFAPLYPPLGLKMDSHRSRAATAEIISRADAIFVMDLENYQSLENAFPAAADKTFLLGLFDDEPDATGDIEDPYTLALPAAKRILQDIDSHVRALFERTYHAKS